MTKSSPVAVITGASSGIGAAAAIALHKGGYSLVLGSRRFDLLEAVGNPLKALCLHLDVTDPESVSSFCSQIPNANLLINNAGGALGLDPISDAKDEDWIRMYETNVLGLMRMTRELLPKLEASGSGHVINIGSIAGREPYPGGGGYNAAKFAVRAISQVMRMEWVGRPVKVTEIAPGMVETEFSIVRFKGDAEKAKRVYHGLVPLTAGDVAEAIVWAATRPPHVNIDEIVMKPLAQATATLAARKLD